MNGNKRKFRLFQFLPSLTVIVTAGFQILPVDPNFYISASSTHVFQSLLQHPIVIYSVSSVSSAKIYSSYQILHHKRSYQNLPFLPASSINSKYWKPRIKKELTFLSALFTLNPTEFLPDLSSRSLPFSG